VQAAVSRLEPTAALGQIERNVIDSCSKAARWFNNRKPEVIVVAWEHDPRTAMLPDLAPAARPQQQQPQRVGHGATAAAAAAAAAGAGGGQRRQQRVRRPTDGAGEGGSSSSAAGKRPRVVRGGGGGGPPNGPKPLPPLQVLPAGVQLPVTHANPRNNPAAAGPDADLAYD
jgi:hypothetical protein